MGRETPKPVIRSITERPWLPTVHGLLARRTDGACDPCADFHDQRNRSSRSLGSRRFGQCDPLTRVELATCGSVDRCSSFELQRDLVEWGGHPPFPCACVPFLDAEVVFPAATCHVTRFATPRARVQGTQQ